MTMTDSEFRYPLDVRFFEVDSLGVVFNMWYLGWCDEAMSAFMESLGYGYATLRAQGMDAVLRKAELEWLDSLQAFQHAEVAVQVAQVGRTSFRLRYDINRVEPEGVDVGRVEVADTAPARGTLCAHATITYVCVGIEGRKTQTIPPGLREALVDAHA
ncbi:MAG: acyl-CoA thioester hydrolase [Actinomycetota bacterium]|nr:acyl-CoA thioester hydrolase [Actinomycetota bacterium]